MPTASLKFGTLIPCNPSSSLGGLCTLKYPLILPYIHDTGCHSCYKHRPHSLWHFQAQTTNQQNHTWSTQTKHRGPRDRQLAAPWVLTAGWTQPAHVCKPDGQFPVRTENTVYLLVLQKTLETHLALNKGNNSFTACGSPGLQSHRSTFLGRIISAPNRISQQTLI